jgi:hypothetical protein
MEHLIAIEKGETIDSTLDYPFAFFHEIDYVIATWLDHRKHGTYPRAGGYDDQDSQLMADWHTMNLYHSRVERGEIIALDMPEDAPDISTMMGG